MINDQVLTEFICRLRTLVDLSLGKFLDSFENSINTRNRNIENDLIDTEIEKCELYDELFTELKDLLEVNNKVYKDILCNLSDIDATMYNNLLKFDNFLQLIDAFIETIRRCIKYGQTNSSDQIKALKVTLEYMESPLV
ncbi:hypothetical protein ACR3K2_11510 [Cryptosporidium serpentis]